MEASGPTDCADLSALRASLSFAVEPLPAAPAAASQQLPAFRDPVYLAAEARLEALFARARVCESHGLAHARDVARLAGGALAALLEAVPEGEGPGLAPAGAARPALPGEDDQLDVLLTALWHDGDDRKFFPENADYRNAAEALAAVGLPRERVDRIVRMISWVSASANGDSVPPEAAERPWLLYPRHADRLSTTGWTGVYRCWKYNEKVGSPLYTAETPRAADEAALWEELATPERYAAYRGHSRSMIDHYYDKLLRLCRGPYDNPFLQGEAERRARPLVEVALLYGQTGGLPAGLFDLARIAAEKECGA